ncbi:MAG: PspC domain-containing protein [Dehalococcoidia bacterium]
MATNRLYRDTDNAMLGGVCSGIGNRFDLDPTLVRVAAIGLALVTAAVPVAIVYLAAWIIMPAGPAAPTGRPSKEQLTEEFRGVGGRVSEAGRIVGRAAKQAADEIAALQRRPGEPGAAPSSPASSSPASSSPASSDDGAPGASTSSPPDAASAPPPTTDDQPAPQAPPPPPPPPLGPWGDDEPRERAQP